MGYSAIGKDEVGKNLWQYGDTTNWQGYYRNITDTEKVFANLDVGKTYIISWDFTSTSSTGAYNQIRLLSGSTEIIRIPNSTPFVMTEEIKQQSISIYFYFGAGNTDGSFTNIMLNEGSIVLPYEPYKLESIQYSPMSGNNEREAN